MVNHLPVHVTKPNIYLIYMGFTRTNKFVNTKGNADSIAMTKLHSMILLCVYFVKLKRNFFRSDKRWPKENHQNTLHEAIMLITWQSYCLQKLHSILIFMTLRDMKRSFIYYSSLILRLIYGNIFRNYNSVEIYSW